MLFFENIYLLTILVYYFDGSSRTYDSALLEDHICESCVILPNFSLTFVMRK